MDLCTFCPKGIKCDGYVLHSLIIRLYDAMGASGSSDELIKILSRDDLLTLANKGAEARKECWRKSFVLSVAHKFLEMAGQDSADGKLQHDAEKMILQMDQLFSKLPKGSAIEHSELVTEIYNQICEDVKINGARQIVPINVISQASMAVSYRKQ